MAHALGNEMNGYKILSFSGQDPALRPYRSMVHSDFKRSLRYGNDWYKLIDSDRYYAAYGIIIDHLLKQKEAQVKLAVLADDPDVCLGWSLSEEPKLHFVFVKRDYRKQGIGAALMPKHFNQITHLTKIAFSIWNNKLKDVIFDPFI